MNDKNFNDWLEKLKNSCDIVEVIERYIPLTKKGDTFWGNCPFHHENTPSFAVKQNGQFFNCFGCGVGGNVFSFIQKIENIKFIDSVKFLADKYNIELPDTLYDENISKIQKKRELLFNATKEAARFYYSTLISNKGKIAYDYLLNRGISKEYINKFGLGYSPDWTSLYNSLIKKFKQETLVEAGLIEKSSKGTYIDPLANRVIFPIFDIRGECTGFSGRAMNKEAFAKYKNTKQSFIFDKSNNLYGLNFIKKDKLNKKINNIIIVEGQIDLIAMHKNGFSNCVATMGTAFTKKHAILIKSFVDEVLVCFDGDSAGQKASLKSLDILREEGIKVKVLIIPDNLDPDDYFKTHSKSDFEIIISNAKDLIEYKLYLIEKSVDLNTKDGLLNYKNRSLTIIRELTDFNEQLLYLKTVQKITNFQFDTLKNELIKTNATVQDKNLSMDSSNKQFKALEYILASIINKKKFAYNVEISAININTELENILQTLQQNNFDISVLEDCNSFEKEIINNLLNYDFTKIKNEESYFEDCMKLINLDYIDKKMYLLSQKLKNSSDENEIKEISSQISQLVMQKQKLKVEDIRFD